MRILCLVLPRLAIQLARKAGPELLDRATVVLTTDGEGALVAATSVEAAAAGIEAGMTLSAARERCPALVAAADNASECLDTLECITSMLHKNATPNVAIGSREHILLDLTGLEARFADEAAAAEGIAGLVRARTGLEVRAAVGSTGGEALAAARRARRFPIVCAPQPELDGDTPRPRRGDIVAVHAWRETPAAVAARARLVRVLAALESMLTGRGESFRELRLTLSPHEGAPVTHTLGAPRPLHRASEALELLAGTLTSDAFEGLREMEVRLARLGPSVEVSPWRQPAPIGRELAPAGPATQQRLLRAS